MMSSHKFDEIWPAHRTYSRKQLKNDHCRIPLNEKSLNEARGFIKCARLEQRGNALGEKKQARTSQATSTVTSQSSTPLQVATASRNFTNSQKFRDSRSTNSGLISGRIRDFLRLSDSTGRTPSFRPIKSPRFGSSRYINVLSSQFDSITSSQENTDGDTDYGGTQGSVDTYGEYDVGDSQLSTVDTVELETDSNDLATSAELISNGCNSKTTTSANPKDEQDTDDLYTYTFTMATGTTNLSARSFDSDNSIELARREPERQQEPVASFSPIEIIPDDCIKAKKSDNMSPTIEYATYWTQPVNRYRLSSTLMDEYAELDIHRGIPMPDISAIPEKTEIHEQQKRQETTPISKVSYKNSRGPSRKSTSTYDICLTPDESNRDTLEGSDGQDDVSTNGEPTHKKRTVHRKGRSVSKVIDFDEMCTTKKLQPPKNTDRKVVKEIDMKMTSTPMQALTSDNLQDFSIELSEIPRVNPEVELDVNESRFVNSDEIVATSQEENEEPLHRTEQNTLTDESSEKAQRSETKRRGSISTRKSKDSTSSSSRSLLKENCVNTMHAGCPKTFRPSINELSTSSSKEMKNTSLTVACVVPETIDGQRVVGHCIETHSQDNALNEKLKKEKVTLESVGKKSQKSRKYSSKSSLSGLSGKRNKENTNAENKRRRNDMKMSKINPRQCLNFEGIPDDILTKNDFPSDDEAFMTKCLLDKWTRPLKPGEATIFRNVPQDFLEVSSEEESVFL